MKQKLKKMITLLCVCLTFFAGALIEFNTDFIPNAIIIGQDIASGMLKIVNEYMVLKENWLEKGLVYKSVLKDNIVLVNHTISTSFCTGGWRLTRIV